jgi:hypothetical protein
MQLPLRSTAYGNEHAVQRGMERHVLTLLHRARNPQALATAPLMDAVCRAMGTQDPVDALQRVVLIVFAGDDESATNLKNSIIDVDFKRTATNAELARQNGLSPRHFARRRAEAIAAIARYTRSILERSSTQPRTGGSYDTAWRFGRERAAFLGARKRGDALEMRAIAGNLLRLAGTRAARLFAVEARADADLRLGRIDEARELLQGLPPHLRLRVAAKLALLAGEPGAAEEYAHAALPACEDDGERYRCLAVISQSRLARSVSWTQPPETARLPFCSWERIAMEVEQARHLARCQRFGDARLLARSTYSRARLLGYREPAARSAAVMHAIERGSVAEANAWRTRAIGLLLETQDRALATGLFLASAYDLECAMDATLGRVLYERLRIVVPQMLGESAEQRTAACDLIAALVDVTLALHDRAAKLDDAARAVARADSALAHYAPTLWEPIVEMLGLAVAAMTGLTWSAALARLRDAFARALPHLRPDAPRTIAVEVPRLGESRSGFPDHLRIDDERPAGIRESTETRTDLRIRRLPVRSGAGIVVSGDDGGAAARTSRAAFDFIDSR